MKDMYADLEKIEERGKRKKEKRKGLFSSFARKEESAPVSNTETAKEPVAEPEPREIAPVPPPAPEPAAWQPLTGGKLKKAQEELLVYKKWLNKGYKSGMLTKEQCVSNVKNKEIELGLRPPE